MILASVLRSIFAVCFSLLMGQSSFAAIDRMNGVELTYRRPPPVRVLETIASVVGIEMTKKWPRPEPVVEAWAKYFEGEKVPSAVAAIGIIVEKYEFPLSAATTTQMEVDANEIVDVFFDEFGKVLLVSESTRPNSVSAVKEVLKRVLLDNVCANYLI